MDIITEYGESKENLELGPLGKTLTLTWKDKTKSRFHSIWLRHNCHCGRCRQANSGQKLLDPSTVSHQVSIEGVCINGEHLEIQWKGDPPHEGYVPLSFLQDHCYESDSLASRRDAVKITKPLQKIPELQYSDLKQTDGRLRWLRHLNEVGVCLLKDVPIQDDTIFKIAELIGPVEDRIHGKAWDLISKPDPNNVAYSTGILDFHMDMMYYESPPGLQVLQCMRFDECVEGGESQFVDVFELAEQFRRDHPQKFDTLARVPTTFQNIQYESDYPVEVRYQRPLITLNPYREVVAVYWAPVAEGPLAVEQHEVEPYYEAYEEFAKAIKFSPKIVEHRLKPGEAVTFNNRRVLHSRKGFTLNGGVRHLRGCNVNIDHFKSQVQVFSRLHGKGEPVKRVGNQDWF